MNTEIIIFVSVGDLVYAQFRMLESIVDNYIREYLAELRKCNRLAADGMSYDFDILDEIQARKRLAIELYNLIHLNT